MIFYVKKNIIIIIQDGILFIMVEEKLMMILIKEEMILIMAKEEKRVAEHLFIMIGAAPLSCSPHFCNHLQTFGPICPICLLISFSSLEGHSQSFAVYSDIAQGHNNCKASFWIKQRTKLSVFWLTRPHVGIKIFAKWY